MCCYLCVVWGETITIVWMMFRGIHTSRLVCTESLRSHIASISLTPCWSSYLPTTGVLWGNSVRLLKPKSLHDASLPYISSRLYTHTLCTVYGVWNSDGFNGYRGNKASFLCRVIENLKAAYTRVRMTSRVSLSPVYVVLSFFRAVPHLVHYIHACIMCIRPHTNTCRCIITSKYHYLSSIT